MDIKKLVEKLIKEHQTTNPFQIAKERKIEIKICDLGDIKGFYKKILRRKYIFINSKLSRLEKTLVCGHELGHALLHNKKEIQFMLDHSKIIRKSNLEDEANIFSWLLFQHGNDDYYYKKDYLNIQRWVDNITKF